MYNNLYASTFHVLCHHEFNIYLFAKNHRKCNKCPIPSKNLRDRARRYIRFILDEQLQPLCKTEKLVANHLQTNYIKHKISQYQSYQPKKPASTSEKIVWQYWAQGIEHSPEIIKICLQSVNSYFSQYGYRVIYLSDNNIREYLDINPLYFKKASTKNGYSIAVLSDLIRFGLLYNYGGIWCDATIFISGNPYYFIENDRIFFERSNQVKFKECFPYISQICNELTKGNFKSTYFNSKEYFPENLNAKKDIILNILKNELPSGFTRSNNGLISINSKQFDLEDVKNFNNALENKMLLDKMKLHESLSDIENY